MAHCRHILNSIDARSLHHCPRQSNYPNDICVSMGVRKNLLSDIWYCAHNGIAKRNHRYIVEISLNLLARASVPSS